MEELRREQLALERGYYADNSWATRSTQIKKYLEFVELFADNRAPFPCTSERVALYAAWLARTLTYRSVINYISGLNFFLKKNGADVISYDNYFVEATLKGIRRAKGDAPHRAPPILPHMLIRVFNELTANQGHIAWRAAVLCCFRALLRKSQVTSSDATLCRSDFLFFDWGMIITVRRCKTIQFMERKLEIPVARCINKALCAVYWTELHFNQILAGPGEAAFRVPSGREGSEPMSYKVYQDTLRLFSNRAGLGDFDFTSHSLRRGGCTFLSMCGATIEELRVRGDWASDAVFGYLKTPLQSRILNDIRVASALANLDVE